MDLFNLGSMCVNYIQHKREKEAIKDDKKSVLEDKKDFTLHSYLKENHKDWRYYWKTL